MKVSQKIISLILVLTMAMGLAITPSFAAAENTEYENSLKSGWGSSTSNFQYPSTYNTSWNRQVINFIDLVATRTLNVYNRLGDMSSTLINISTNTGYIQSISQHFNSTLHSGWGDSSSYFTVPSGMRGSWYGATLMLLDTIQQKLSEPLNLTLDPTTSAILFNIDEQVTTSSSILGSIDIGIQKLSAMPKLYNINFIKRSTVNGTVSNVSANVPRAISYSSGQGYYFADLNNSSVDNPLDYLSLINSNILGVFSSIYTPTSRYRINRFDGTGTSSSYYFAYSLSDFLYGISQDLGSMVDKLTYVIADPDTIAAKQANKNQEQSVLNNFTGSGDVAASVNDFVGVKDSVSALKTSLSGGASYTQAFNILSGDSDGWLWFTNEVAESMDSTSNGNTRLRSVSDSTTYLDSYYEQLSSYLGYSYNGGIE